MQIVGFPMRRLNLKPVNQYISDITSITPSSGSTEGGLTLTIYGNYFDDQLPYTQPKVFVGGRFFNNLFISPKSGSTEGGLTLTIYGNYFDDKLPYTQPKVFVGGGLSIISL